MPTAPGMYVCVCVCPLLQVCVHLDGSNAENKISKPIFFFYITDYGKMLKYREKYRSTDISVDLYLS